MAEMTLTISALDKASAVIKGVASGSLSAFNSITGGVTALSTAFTALSSVVSGVFTVIKSAVSAVSGSIFDFGKSVISAGSDWETMSVRMNALTGSAKAGAEAMAFLSEKAATLPYTLNEVIEGATGIKAFGMEIKKWTTPLADVAAFMGVTLPEAAGAMGRAFAGGAGAADIFRERGVLELIKSFTGIKDLTTMTLPAFQKAMYDTFTSGKVGIAGMTDALGATFTGKLSTLQDYWDAFKRKVSEDVFPKIKGGLDDILSKIDKWSKDGSLNEWASLLGTAMANAFDAIKGVVVSVYEKLTEWAKSGELSAWFNRAAESARALWNYFIDAIPRAIIAAGEFAAGVLNLVWAFTEVKTAVGDLLISVAFAFDSMPNAVKKLFGVTDELVSEMAMAGAVMKEEATATAVKYAAMGDSIKSTMGGVAGYVAEMTSSLKADLAKPVEAFNFIKASADSIPKDVQIKVTTTYVDVRDNQNSAATASKAGTGEMLMPGGASTNYGNWGGAYPATP